MKAEWKECKGYTSGWELFLAPGIKGSVHYDAAVPKGYVGPRYVAFALGLRHKDRFESPFEAKAWVETRIRRSLKVALADIE